MMLQNQRQEELHRAVEMAALPVPLLVELEGGLLSADIRLERLAANLSAGRMKAAIGCLTGTDGEEGLETVARTLPLKEEAEVVITNAHRAGRPVYLLASPAMKPLALLLQQRLGSVTGVLSKADFSTHPESVLRMTGQGVDFDYLGAAGTDSPGWRAARRAYAVGMSAGHSDAFRREGLDVTALSGKTSSAKALVKLLRPHQYAKNLLVFVPALTSHQLAGQAFVSALIAFVCFSLAASAVYVINDFIDLHADRGHPSKRRRPFASGAVSPAHGLLLVPLLLAASALLATQLPPLFAALLAGYMALTTAYSFSLKKMMLVDVTVLSLLYSMRVVAGAGAVQVAVSEWLFAFCLMFFTALALTKRYVELSARLDKELPDPSNRDYRVADLPIIAALAAAAGMNAITVLALYVNSDTVKQLYSRPALLWLLCPLFLYWIGRVLLLAHRRQLHDDPIVFALTDVRSWLVGASTLTLVALAM